MKTKKICQSVPASIRDIMEEAVRTEPEHISYRFKQNGTVRDVTMSEFYASVEALGASLTKRGFGHAHIACVAENSYPWIQTYLTVLMTAGVFVPMDKELPEDQLLFILNDSDTEVVFCDKKREEKLLAVRDKLPNVKYFVTFEREKDDGDCLSFRGLLSEGEKLPKGDFDALRSDPYELKDLVYTSGTTGTAKGVMLTEHNLVSGVHYGLMLSQIAGTCLSVLPYNHTYEAVCDILVSIRAKTTLCINESLRKVQDNLKLYKPDYIYLVPAFADHFYKSIVANIEKQGKKKIFERMMRVSDGLRKVGIDLRRVFFGAIHKEFGGHLKRIVCGGAPIRPDIGMFFDRIGFTMSGGYGITECSPLVSVNDDDKTNNFASAGHHIACIDWKIDKPDADGIGEILVKGDVVMLGYYKRPDLTAEALRDGWFYTGDYGLINEKGEIVITGRKKNMIVLQNGKNVFPEEPEFYITEIPYVTEAVVRGEENEFGEVVSLLAELYIDGERPSEDQIKADIKAAMKSLPAYKQIAHIKLRDEPFAKTTTQKIKRS